MHLTQKLAEAERENRTWWSFEYFPPRTPQGFTNLLDRIDRMRELGGSFVDITWNAGGRSSELTADLVKAVQSLVGVDTCMHLTCTNMPREMIDKALKDAKESGCMNILALRGDPPAQGARWEKCEAGFEQAIDLVKYIKSQYGDHFEIAVAGFPEGHFLGEDPVQEMKYLKAKIDAGAKVIFSQMFYNVDIFIQWVKDVRAAGITVPIIPGIMPIQAWSNWQRALKMNDTIVPQYFLDKLGPVKDDDEMVRCIGTKLVSDMCRKILAADIGISGLHLYTMNLERGVTMILEDLDLVPHIDVLKPLPWRQCLTPARRHEKTRPIFWSNRQKSFLSRTSSWDQFVSGRYGDSRSPAFGDDLGAHLGLSMQQAEDLWGSPQNIQEIRALFSRYCQGQLTRLPWSDQPIAKETEIINEQLAAINQAGFLTINSQPALDGVPSSHPTHGWGPKNGYVYQKAYLEFFVSNDMLQQILPFIEEDEQITYHIVNKEGELTANSPVDGGFNAVTFGVFPGREIQQPTIVEQTSFLAWKDEAYGLGMEWAMTYKEDSITRKLLTNTFEEFLLVNLVHNDYHKPLSIFKPFQRYSEAQVQK